MRKVQITSDAPISPNVKIVDAETGSPFPLISKMVIYCEAGGGVMAWFQEEGVAVETWVAEVVGLDLQAIAMHYHGYQGCAKPHQVPLHSSTITSNHNSA